LIVVAGKGGPATLVWPFQIKRPMGKKQIAREKRERERED
jgi:hypothetical protein